ncbi:MAG TPA: amidohydrolase family protein [Myxococcota bacterium]|nr:amidohydrolase family protein [Myxococcota bacterium]HQK49848.1 amidohydrolase family protein [Myxococcota bacterium]
MTAPSSPTSGFVPRHLPPARPVFLRGGTVLTMDPYDTVIEADILVQDGRIAAIGAFLTPPEEAIVLPAENAYVLPGFVQTHVHLCQTLWRNHADDLPLMEWLRQWTWPMEAAHDEASIRAAARLGAAELLLSGTTTINDMGTVRHTGVVIRSALEMGLRGVFSKVLMDCHDGPEALRENPDQGLQESLVLAERCRETGGLARFALAPRFAVSSSFHLLEGVAAAANRTGLLVHTHCAETEEEVQITVDRFGCRPVDLFAQLGLLDRRLLLAHCVHLTREEIRRLAAAGSAVLHCPSANLKLGSGIAPIPAMIEAGVRVGIGADGAPCNNNLDIFQEMRAAALVQKALHGPTAMPAGQVLRMATIGGAEVLGLQDEIGSVVRGKRADLVVLDRRAPHCVPAGDPAAAIVYSMGRDDVRHVVVDGRVVVEDRTLKTAPLDLVVQEAVDQTERLLRRAKDHRPPDSRE